MEGYTSSAWSGYLGIRGYAYWTTSTSDSSVTVSVFGIGQMCDAYYYGLSCQVQINNQNGSWANSAYANGALTSHPGGWGNVCRTSTVSASFPRGAKAYSVTVHCRAYGETTSSGYGAFPGNTGWSKLGSVGVPALAKPGTPPSATATLSGTTGAVSWTHGSGIKTKSWVDVRLNAESWLNVYNGAYKSSHQVTNLLPNSKYDFRVYDGNDAAWSGARESNAIYTEPSAPSDLAASAEGTTVRLAWSTNAYEASTVELQRSESPGFSSYTVVYSGLAKSSHTDTPPSGTMYYRVRAYAPGGTTGYSNVSSATTMLAPQAPAGLSRLSPFDADTLALSWTNASTETAPYSSIEVQVDETSSFSFPGTKTLSGSVSSVLYSAEPGEKLYVRIRAKNPVGESPWVQIGPVYTSAPLLENTSVSSLGRTVTFEWTDPFAFPSERISPSVQIDISTSEDGETWEEWEPVSAYEDLGTSYLAVEEVEKRCYIRSRASITYNVPSDDEARTTGWVEGREYLVQVEPEPPVVSYDKGTLTATVSFTDTLDTPRTVALVIDGSVVDTRQVSGTTKSYSVSAVTGSRMSMYATVETVMWPAPVSSETISVDLDSLPVYIKEKRHLAFLVAEDGTVTPAAVSYV